MSKSSCNMDLIPRYLAQQGIVLAGMIYQVLQMLWRQLSRVYPCKFNMNCTA